MNLELSYLSSRSLARFAVTSSSLSACVVGRSLLFDGMLLGFLSAIKVIRVWNDSKRIQRILVPSNSSKSE